MITLNQAIKFVRTALETKQNIVVGGSVFEYFENDNGDDDDDETNENVMEMAYNVLNWASLGDTITLTPSSFSPNRTIYYISA